MKRWIMIIPIALILAAGQLGCCMISLPDINIPTVEVGEMQETDEFILAEDAGSTNVTLLFGAGNLSIQSGDEENLLAGHFRYNVEEWEPDISYSNDNLRITQGDSEQNWGWPDQGDAHNEWDLAFSPDVPLDMRITAGAGEGDIDLSDLQIEDLDCDLGAGDFMIDFGTPNPVEMDRLSVNTGASHLEITNLGNASPESVVIQGGAGEIEVDLRGEWTRSADIEITAGVGEVTLRLPDNVSVEIDVDGGLADVNASDFDRDNGNYVNDMYGESDIELRIDITTGVGSINLIEVSND